MWDLLLANMRARGELVALAPDKLGGQFMVVRGILLGVVRKLGGIVGEGTLGGATHFACGA